MILFKFGRRKHLEEFRDAGLLYMNTQRFFADLEGDMVRGDRFEDTDQIHQPSGITELRIDNLVFQPEQLVGPVLIRLSERPSCNLFCMFAATGPLEGPFVDKRNFEFGDAFIVVLNAAEFINRVRSSASLAGARTFSHGLIEYYDPLTHSGDTGPFRKPSTLAFQREFRISIEPGATEPIKLSIGSLTDITSSVYPLPDINRIVDLKNAWVGG